MLWKKSVTWCFLCLFISLCAKAQQATQTIRGTVTDKVSMAPLMGAIIKINTNGEVKTAVADSNGYYKITGIPIGNQNIVVSYLGYKQYTANNIVLDAGKELVLNVELEESIVEGKTVVVTNKIEKDKALNEMSVVSTRTFSVEETQKYAASINDPMRMATSFAGVVQGSDGNNSISIRGNSPNGLLWRMEGVDVPNPNHFSNIGSAGGGISILSSQLLANSDFSTGAFAAEYGDALSGVFDLKLRKGNNEKNEFTFQPSVMGIDAAMEGPFKKGYAGSYLINYRYSTLSILNWFGISLTGSSITNFQDLSFNFYFPTKNMGNFEIFGFGGLSSQTTTASREDKSAAIGPVS